MFLKQRPETICDFAIWLRDAIDDKLFPNGKPFMAEHEASDWLGLAATTLRDARLRGEIVAGKQGRAHVYTLDDLLAWHNKTKNGKSLPR
jgi:hypothetical protein